MASHSSPRRIMAWMPRIWPSTRARRLSMASCCCGFGVLMSQLQRAAQGEGAAQLACTEAECLILRVVLFDQAYQLGLYGRAVAGEAGFAGGYRAHVAEFAIHHFGPAQPGNGFTGLAALLELFQHLAFPNIRLVVRVAQAQRSTADFPWRSAVLPGDLRRQFAACLHGPGGASAGNGSLHGAQHLLLERRDQGLGL